MRDALHSYVALCAAHERIADLDRRFLRQLHILLKTLQRETVPLVMRKLRTLAQIGLIKLIDLHRRLQNR